MQAAHTDITFFVHDWTWVLNAWQATKDVLAMAALEIDLSKVEMGQTVTVKWRGKPVFVRHRSESDVEDANKVDLSQLRDPQSDSDRSVKPEVQFSPQPTHHLALCRSCGVLHCILHRLP